MEKFNLSFEMLNNKEKEDVKKKLKERFKEISEEYIHDFLIFSKSNKGIKVAPKISLLPSYDNKLFTRGEKVKKLINQVASYLESITQLQQIKLSMGFLISELETKSAESQPYLESLLAGCISIYFSIFNESQGFMSISVNDFKEHISKNQNIYTSFEILYELRNKFYCHKEKAIGIHYLSFFLDENDLLRVHTDEKIIPYYAYKENLVLKTFVSLIDETILYINDSMLPSYKKKLEKMLNYIKHKKELKLILQQAEYDLETHHKKVKQIVDDIIKNNLNRISVQGNKQ